MRKRLGSTNNSKNNLHIAVDELIIANRISKEVKSLIDQKIVDNITVLGFFNHKNDNELRTTPFNNVEFYKLCLHNKPDSNIISKCLFYLEFYYKILRHGIKYEYQIINVHNIHLLPVAAILKLIKSSKIIYDTHELETEVSDSKGLMRYIYKLIEFTFMPFVDNCIVVNEHIASWYKDKYPAKFFTVIKNAIDIRDKEHLVSKPNYFRKKYNLEKDQTIFLYQGILSESRGTDLILEVFQLVNPILHVVFLGDGPLRNRIVELESSTPNIHYHPLVPKNDLYKLTASADVGIHFILNTCLNHYYCLPNKLFEYLHAGIPQIVSNFPEMESFVKGNEIGWTINPQLADIVRLINNLNKEEIQRVSLNCEKTKNKYSWEIEEKNYFDVYSSLQF